PAKKKTVKRQGNSRLICRLLILFAIFMASYSTSADIRYQPRSAFLHHPCPAVTVPRKGDPMSFSGSRAIILVAVLIGLVVAVTKFDLPGWLVPVGVVAMGALLKNSEKAASN